MRQSIFKNKFMILTITAIAVYFTLISAYPFVFNFVLSFFKTDLLTGYNAYGLGNYRYLFNNKVFWSSLWHNVYYLIILVSVGLVTSLIVAFLIYQTSGIAKKIYIAMYFAPVVTSFVAVALIWKLLYFPKTGLFPVMFQALSITPPNFLEDPKIALLCIIIIDIWKDTGLRAVILLAAMEEIPQQLFEAARIDGAKPIRQFWNITIPLLKPQMLFIVTIYSINSIRVFKQVYMVAGPGGGPSNSTKTLAVMMYQESFGFLRFGAGTAIANIIFFLLFGLVLLQINMYRKKLS